MPIATKLDKVVTYLDMLSPIKSRPFNLVASLGHVTD